MDHLDNTLLENEKKVESTYKNDIETTYVSKEYSISSNIETTQANILPSNLLIDTSLESTSITSNGAIQSESTDAFSSNIKASVDPPRTSIMQEKENYKTNSLLKTTGIPIKTFTENKQTIFNMDSTFKEEITEETTSFAVKVQKTTSEMKKEIKASDLKIVQTTPDTIGPTTSKADSDQLNIPNIVTTGYITSKADILEPTTNKENISESTTFKVDFNEPLLLKMIVYNLLIQS